MSLQAQRAVNASRLEPWLRHLAVALAFYEPEGDKHGATIRPGIRTLAQALGRTERMVYYGIQALVARHILIRTGWHHRTRCYRLDRAQLASYQPSLTPEMGFRSQARRSEVATPEMGFSLTPEMGFSLGPRVLISDLKTDLKKNHEEPTGAPAPAPLPEREEPEEEQNEEAPKEAPQDEPEPDPVFAPAFAVYARLAQLALQLAVLERDDSFSNVAEHLKSLCAQHRQPYDAEIIRKAVDTAFHMRDRRARETWTAARAIFAKPQPASTPHPRRVRDLARTG